MDNTLYAKAGKKLREYYASPLCLIAFIFACGTFINAILVAIFGSSGITDLIEQFDSTGAFSRMNGFSSAFDTSAVVTGIWSCLLTGLFALAIGLIYFMSKRDSSPSAGFTIIKVFGIFGIVMSAFVGLLFILFSIVAVIIIASGNLLAELLQSYDFSGIYDDTLLTSSGFENAVASTVMPIVTTILIIAIVVLLAVFVLMLLYYINMTRFASSMKRGLREPYLHVKGATFFGVFMIITGAALALGSLGSLAAVLRNPMLALMQLFGGICGAGMYITFGILVAGFKKYAVRVNAELEAEYEQCAREYAAVNQPPVQQSYPVNSYAGNNYGANNYNGNNYNDNNYNGNNNFY